MFDFFRNKGSQIRQLMVWLIVLLVLIPIFNWSSNNKNPSCVKAMPGQFDFRTCSFDLPHEMIALSGQWQFEWGVFGNENRNTEQTLAQNSISYLSVPGNTKSHRSNPCYIGKSSFSEFDFQRETILE